MEKETDGEAAPEGPAPGSGVSRQADGREQQHRQPGRHRQHVVPGPPADQKETRKREGDAQGHGERRDQAAPAAEDEAGGVARHQMHEGIDLEGGGRQAQAVAGDRAGEPEGRIGERIDPDVGEGGAHQLVRVVIRPAARIHDRAAVEDRAQELGVVVVLDEIERLRHFQQGEAGDDDAEAEGEPGRGRRRPVGRPSRRLAPDDQGAEPARDARGPESPQSEPSQRERDHRDRGEGTGQHRARGRPVDGRDFKAREGARREVTGGRGQDFLARRGVQRPPFLGQCPGVVAPGFVADGEVDFRHGLSPAGGQAERELADRDSLQPPFSVCARPLDRLHADRRDDPESRMRQGRALAGDEFEADGERVGAGTHRPPVADHGEDGDQQNGGADGEETGTARGWREIDSFAHGFAAAPRAPRESRAGA